MAGHYIYTYTVVVTDKNTGAPIKGALVTFTVYPGDGTEDVQTWQTDDNGLISHQVFQPSDNITVPHVNILVTNPGYQSKSADDLWYNHYKSTIPLHPFDTSGVPNTEIKLVPVPAPSTPPVTPPVGSGSIGSSSGNSSSSKIGLGILVLVLLAIAATIGFIF